MLHTTAVINYFNNGHLYVKHRASNNKLWIFCNKNYKMFLSSPKTNKHDVLNNACSGYRLTKKLNILYRKRAVLGWFLLQWAKLAFRGKSFRIRNFCRYNKFTFNFGYSHWTKLKLQKRWFFFKRRRQRYLIITFFLKDFNFFRRFFPKIKIYNCYTMRGLRFKRQAIIRRFGKISQHISSLH